MPRRRSIGLAVLLALGVAAAAQGQGLRSLLGLGRAASAEGLEEIEIREDGRDRLALVYRPDTLSPPSGALLVYHGRGGSAAQTSGAYGIREAADRAGFVAVFLDSGGERWNDGRPGTSGGADDLRYTRAVVNELENRFGVDPSRVFAAGVSNGGIFAYRLACDAPDLVAGIAAVAASMPEAMGQHCTPNRPVPVVMINGTEDPLIPYWGGQPERRRLMAMANGGGDPDPMMSSPATAEFWARIDGCGGAERLDLPDHSDDGTTVTRIEHVGCEGARVLLLQVNGGGHGWPGSDQRERRLTGEISQDIDATAEIVSFFESYGL